LFLTPFSVIIAASGVPAKIGAGPHSRPSDRGEALRQPEPGFGLLIVAVLLGIQLLVFNAFLRVVTTGIEDPPKRTQAFEVPAIEHPTSAVFSESVELLGYDIESADASDGDGVILTLYWRPLGPVSHSYTVFNHIVGPDGSLVGQHDGIPMQGQVPTTCWVPGEVVTDVHHISLPAEVESGTYTLLTGLYRWETKERLDVRGDGAHDDGAVELAEVRLIGTDS